MTESPHNELTLLANRRNELARQRNEAIRLLSAVDKELSEIDYAGRVVARLMGASWPPAGAPDAMAPPSLGNVVEVKGVSAEAAVGAIVVAVGRPTIPVSGMTTPDMIVSVLADAHAAGIGGLSPAEIRDRITERFKVTLPKEGISPTVWRLGRSGRLMKIREGVYSLPKKNEATDLLSGPDQSAASDREPGAQGGEARPGGGT